MAIWDPTAKFNSRQYFRLYGMQQCHVCHARLADLHLAEERQEIVFSAKSSQCICLKGHKEPYNTSLETYAEGMYSVAASAVTDTQTHTHRTTTVPLVQAPRVNKFSFMYTISEATRSSLGGH